MKSKLKIIQSTCTSSKEDRLQTVGGVAHTRHAPIKPQTNWRKYGHKTSTLPPKR